MKTISALSNREMEVAFLLVRGYIKKEIADRLGISVNTVRNHTTNIYEKLSVTSIGQLCWAWNEQGMNSKLFTTFSIQKAIIRRKKTRVYIS